ncbi:MAG: UPF0721 transmembrane protein [Alphaproteobacteria bacterium]|nr:MAG: UPF0721 transmembrane protein [Alphaproteobacteria bacterium]
MHVMPALADLVPFLAAMVAAGAVAGFLAGLFGIGGGAVLVPVFYQVLGAIGVDEAIRMHLSVGTSLAIIVPTSLRSFRSHLARGAVDTGLLRTFVVPVPVGVVAASIIAAYLSGAGLRGIFAVITTLVGLKLLLARENWRIGADIPGNPIRSVAGFIIGFFSTFMGIGGGIFNNTFMTLYGRPMLQSVATSSGVGVLISIPGMFGYVWAGWGEAGLPVLSLGFVNLIMVAVTIPLTLAFAPLGVGVAHRLSRRQLEVGFGLFLLIVSARFFYSLAG